MRLRIFTFPRPPRRQHHLFRGIGTGTFVSFSFSFYSLIPVPFATMIRHITVTTTRQNPDQWVNRLDGRVERPRSGALRVCWGHRLRNINREPRRRPLPELFPAVETLRRGLDDTRNISRADTIFFHGLSHHLPNRTLCYHILLVWSRRRMRTRATS
jgi:hypothetical protein